MADFYEIKNIPIINIADYNTHFVVVNTRYAIYKFIGAHNDCTPINY